MRFESLQVTGSFQVSGSARIPFGPSSSRTTQTGSLFFDTDNNRLEINRGNDWYSGSGAGSGGSGGGAVTSVDIEYLVIAGGGAGSAGFGNGNGTGGGGAGGMLSASFSSISSGSTFTITVGAGGAGGTGTDFANKGATNRGSDGGDSSISGTDITTVTATGGGSGGRGSADWSGNDGGSGGGEGAYAGNGAPGSGTTGQGNDGGASTPTGNTDFRGGGGGGKGAAGVSGVTSGNGGAGQVSNITGTSTTYAGGGGGGCYQGRTAGTGGTGGGGDGSAGSAAATSGTANTGAGGGGSGWPGSGATVAGNSGAGGSGVVILAYDSGSGQGAGGISGDAGSGRRYHQFNSSDSFVMGAVGDFDVVTDGLLVNLDAGDFSSRGTSTWTDLEDSNDGSVSGATLGANWYYDFDGSNDYISFSTFPNGADYKAFEIWINPDSYANYAFQHGNGQETENYLRFLSTDDIQLRMRNQTITVSGYSTNTWYHIVGQLDESNFPNLWIDGTEVSTGTTAATATFTAETVSLGRRINTGFSNIFWNGQIAQFRIYQNTLTDAQIAQNYNATKTNFV